MGRGVAAPPHVEWEGRRGGEGERGQGVVEMVMVVKRMFGMVVVARRRAKMSLIMWAGGWCP